MRLELTLTPSVGHGLLPVNYQYPLSAAIYKIIQQADEKYSAFLHDTDYSTVKTLSCSVFLTCVYPGDPFADCPPGINSRICKKCSYFDFCYRGNMN
jgi:hypothetical protein